MKKLYSLIIIKLMSFRRRPTIYHPSATQFGNLLTRISEVQHIPENLIIAAQKIGISRNMLARIMLSTEATQTEYLQLIRNLSATLEQYPNELPEQLQQHIIHLGTLATPVDDASLPPYFDYIITAEAPPVVFVHDIPEPDFDVPDPDFDVPEPDFDDWHPIGNEFDEPYDEPHEVVLTAIPAEGVKDDACVMCLCHLTTEPVSAVSCTHQYHTACIKQWLTVKQVCPLCNQIL
jgi:hypothetical protein